MASEQETRALLQEYDANIRLYVAVSEVRQSRINWTFLIQGALLAALIGSDQFPIKVVACALGVVLSAAAYVVIGRHTAYQRVRAFQAEDVESRLRAVLGGDYPSTFQREREIFQPGQRNGLWRALADHLPMPTPASQYIFPAVNRILPIRWYERWSANQFEQLLVGAVFLVLWVVLLALVAAGSLTGESVNVPGGIRDPTP